LNIVWLWYKLCTVCDIRSDMWLCDAGAASKVVSHSPLRNVSTSCEELICFFLVYRYGGCRWWCCWDWYTGVNITADDESSSCKAAAAGRWTETGKHFFTQ